MTRAVLERKTRTDLLQLAKRAGLRGISLLKRAALIEALLRTAAAPSLRRHAKKKRGSPRPSAAPAKPAAAQKEVKPTVKAKRKPAAKKIKAASLPKPAAPAKAPAARKAAVSKPKSPAAPAPARPPALAAVAPVTPPPGPVTPASKPTPAAPAPARKKAPCLTELPAEYGKTGLVLMEVDPRHLHIYWEVTPADQQAALKKLGKDATSSTWILRFYDTTYINFNGQNAHSHFDVPIDLSIGNWYLELWSGEKTYCAEIGPRSAAGQFVPAARSNFVQIPRGQQSPEYRPEWTKVEHPAGELSMPVTVAASATGPSAQPGAVSATTPPAAATSPAVAGASAPAPALLATPPTTQESQEITAAKVRRHYEDMVTAAVEVPSHPPAPAAGSAASCVPEIGALPASQPGPGAPAPSSPASSSFGLGSGGSMFPAARPSIDLKLNTEIVVSGRAQPGQTVQLNGHWIKVNADGTFSVRLALPVAQD